jgi:pimeloyl-ACP methyl ester carboxylesterase
MRVELKCPRCAKWLTLKSHMINAFGEITCSHGRCGYRHSARMWIDVSGDRCRLPNNTYFHTAEGTSQKTGLGLLRAVLRSDVMKGGNDTTVTGESRNISAVRTPGDNNRVTIQLVDDEVTLRGVHVMASDSGDANKTILLLSGSGASISGMSDENDNIVGVAGIVDGYLGKNCNVLAVDYRGYGNSDGTPSSRGFYSDAMAMVGFLTGHKDAKGLGLKVNNIIVHGWSIGSGPAVETTLRLQQQGRSPAGLVLHCAIASTYAVGTNMTGSRAAGWLADKAFGFRNEAKMPSVRVPVVVLWGSQDATFRDFGPVLAGAANEPKRYGAFNGGHYSHSAIFRAQTGQHIDWILTQ